MSDATYKAVSGVCSAGFITTTVPAARAGPSFHACISSGKFQGITCPTTPTGSWRVYVRKLPSEESNLYIRLMMKPYTAINKAQHNYFGPPALRARGHQNNKKTFSRSFRSVHVCSAVDYKYTCPSLIIENYRVGIHLYVCPISTEYSNWSLPSSWRILAPPPPPPPLWMGWSQVASPPQVICLGFLDNSLVQCICLFILLGEDKEFGSSVACPRKRHSLMANI